MRTSARSPPNDKLTACTRSSSDASHCCITSACAAPLQMHVKEDLSTVSLGTSKINYMDPRITVAWCKRNEAPIEKLFNKSLMGKFNWAMEEDPEFVF